MNLEVLIGLTLDRCQFSRSGYSFEFSDTVNGTHKHFKLSTSYCVSFSEKNIVDIEDKFSCGAWPLLEQKIVDISVSEEETKISIELDSSGVIIIWPGDIPPIDNLAIFEDLVSEQWSPIL